MQMTVSLQQLPSTMNTMFEEMVTTNNGGSAVKKTNEYVMEALNVIVTVTMARSESREIPERLPWCGGKSCSDEAEVTVSPANEKVEQTVADFFKACVTPGCGMSPPAPTFEKVVINGKEISMY